MNRSYAAGIYLGLLLWLVPSPGRAQTDKNQISSASFTVFAPPNFYIDLRFTNALATPELDLASGNIQITTMPAALAPPLSLPSAALLSGSLRTLRISFMSGLPSPEPSSAQVCFSHVSFIESDGTTKGLQNVCSNAQILNSANVVAQKSLLLKNLQAVPKTSDEKNVFASGFVTTASSGTAGGLNLDLNSNQLGIPGMTAFLRTNKTSVAGGDPKNLEIGANFRGAYLFGKRTLRKIRDDISTLEVAPSDVVASKDINAQEEALGRQLMSAVLVDTAGKVEGEGNNFDVGNYVADLRVSLQSRTNVLLGSTKGFWEFRILPVGFEGGKNIQTTSTASATSPSTTSMQEDLIARYKGGGQFHLFYDDSANMLPFKRIDLTMQTVQRILFLNEAQTSSRGTTSYSDGSRAWYDANLIAYFAETTGGRFGFKLTYNDGSLPPSFTKARSFNFGFVFETPDGEQK